MKNLHLIKKICVLLIGFSYMSGCVPAPPIISGRDISQVQLSKIKEGTTSKSELLALLGPPYAILRQGKTAKMQDPPVYNSASDISKSGTKLLDGDAVFSIFMDDVDIHKDHRVYYYYYSKSSKTGIILLLYMHEAVKNKFNEFYFLVDERNQVVDKIFFMKSKPTTKTVNKNEKEDRTL